ncbi:MAG: thioredoxin family protein [Phycisphaeraceae bacterium]
MNESSTNSQPAHGKGTNVPATLAIFLIVIAVAAPFLFMGSGKDLVPWRSDLAAASQEAETGNKLLMLDFTAEWCGPCKTMKRTTFADETVKAALEKDFIPVKMDMTDSGPRQAAWSREYSITGVPTLLVTDAKGRLLARHVGGMDSKAFIAWLDDAKQRAGHE